MVRAKPATDDTLLYGEQRCMQKRTFAWFRRHARSRADELYYPRSDITFTVGIIFYVLTWKRIERIGIR